MRDRKFLVQDRVSSVKEYYIAIVLLSLALYIPECSSADQETDAPDGLEMVGDGSTGATGSFDVAVLTTHPRVMNPLLLLVKALDSEGNPLSVTPAG